MTSPLVVFSMDK